VTEGLSNASCIASRPSRRQLSAIRATCRALRSIRYRDLSSSCDVWALVPLCYASGLSIHAALARAARVVDELLSIVGVDLLKGYARRRAPHEHAAVSPAAPAKSVLARPVETTAAFAGR
jgi:hypothetical protein